MEILFILVQFIIICTSLFFMGWLIYWGLRFYVPRFDYWIRIRFMDGIYCGDCRFYNDEFDSCEAKENRGPTAKRSYLYRIVVYAYKKPPNILNKNNNCRLFRYYKK